MLRGDEANIKLLAVCDPSLSNSAYKAMSFGKQEKVNEAAKEKQPR
jgi:hypothetical protein